MDEKSTQQIISENLKILMKERNINQSELAKIAGVSESAAGKWILKKSAPRMGAIQKIADHFDIPKSFILEERSKKESLYLREESAEYVAHSPAEEIVPVPIVGKIACGKGVLTYEEIEGYEYIPKNWMNGGKYFFLRAHGDSMTGFRIQDNDLLLIREQPEVENGEIAAVDINGEAVLKRVTRSGSNLILESGNPNYPPRIVDLSDSDCTIMGRLKKIIVNL